MSKVSLTQEERQHLQGCLTQYLSDLYTQGQQSQPEFSAVSELLSKMRQRSSARCMELVESDLDVLSQTECLSRCDLPALAQKVAN